MGMFILLVGNSLHAQDKMQDHYKQGFEEAGRVLMQGDMAKGEKIIMDMQQEAMKSGHKHVVIRTYIAVSYTHLTLPTIYSV